MSGNSKAKESNKAVKPPVNKTTPTPRNTPTAKQKLDEPSMDDSNELKEKATFNLPIKLLHELEDKWVSLRKKSRNKQISKTLIVEKALELAFSEFDLKDESSKLYSKICGT